VLGPNIEHERSGESCAVYPLPTTLDGLALSIGTMRCGASNGPRRPVGMLVGTGRSMRLRVEDDGTGFGRIDDEGRLVLRTGIGTFVGSDVGNVTLRRAANS
jgi:hypothetical protein